MDFKQLEAFAQVVSLGSFSKAAGKLHLTQPTVSAHISSLEGEMDAQLILRTPKGAVPTETGKVLYEYALDMLALREKATLACQKQQQEMGGVLAIAASTIPYQHVLPQMMAAFREKHPAVRFEVISSDSAGVEHAILDGKAEIGMAGARGESSQLAFEDFMEDELVVIAPPTEQYVGMGAGAFPLDALVAHPFVLREEGSGTRRETEAFLQRAGVPPAALQVVAQMDNPDALKNAVSRGLGVSVISRLACVDMERFGMLRVFPLEKGGAVRKLYLVRHKRRPPSPAAAAFLRFVAADKTALTPRAAAENPPVD